MIQLSLLPSTKYLQFSVRGDSNSVCGGDSLENPEPQANLDREQSERTMMTPEQINQLHEELVSYDREFAEIQQGWQDLHLRWQSSTEEWEARVIAIGQALIDNRAGHRKGWKRDFPSLGFKFKFGVACRYIACAEQPDARGEENSVEIWAKAAAERKRAANEAETAKELARQRRAEGRTLKESNLLEAAAVNEEVDSALVGMPKDHLPSEQPQLTDVAVASPMQDQMQVSFEQLHEAIVCNPKLKQLKPHWKRLLEGLGHGLIPHIRAVSLDEADDTVESGGIDISFNSKTEWLNA